MIIINKELLFYKDANSHSKDTISYEKRIKNKRESTEYEENIRINSDGSITVGLCNGYAISINDKFQCPLDERKHIFGSEKQNIIKYDDTYKCENFCIVSEIKKSKTNYISEENIVKITNRLKDFVMKA